MQKSFVKRSIRGHDFRFLPEGVVLWEERQSLLLADLHIGKSTHFRNNGLPLGLHAVRKDIGILGGLIEQQDVQELILLGDVFHSIANQEHDWFIDFLNHLNISVQFITGNHDRHSTGDLVQKLDPKIQLSQVIKLEGFLLSHEPMLEEGQFNFCGHIHPAYLLKGKGRQRHRCACFAIYHNRCVLPAFGSLNGHSLIERKSGRPEILLLSNGLIYEL